jgi:tRNA(Ile)-lysidine synthase
MTPFAHTVSDFIARHQLMHRDGLYLVGLSGGPDSVALLRVLLELGYRVEAMHCNFNLRGEESRRDEAFCVDLCKKLGVAIHLTHFDTLSYSQLHHVSIEMAARDLRYHYFRQLLHDMDADGIVIAHHQDDNVETVLLNLVRGTGLQGLQGIHPKQGNVLRPLLGVKRSEILDYLKALNQDFVVDSTNLEDDARRNVIRHQVVPVLEKLNPSFVDKVTQMTEHLSEVSQLVDTVTKQWIDDARLADNEYDTLRLKKMPSSELVYWQLLGPLGFTPSQVSDIATCTSSGKVWLSKEKVAMTHQDRLIIVDRSQWEQPLPTLKVPEEGNYIYGQDKKLKVSIAPYITPDQISLESLRATLDADKVKFPLTLRACVEGDRFQPFGMKGMKLVSDFLTDHHCSLLDKHRQLVVTDATGAIVWLVGQRTDGRFAIVKESTLHILTLEFRP